MVVDDITFSADAGEIVTLLGPSGSGKTTLLRMIAGFVPARRGSILVGGSDVTALPVHRRNIGMVFQNYALFPHLNVRDNIAYPLARAKVRRAARPSIVAEALDAVRLPGVEERMPSQLSGGQQQRIALARAIVNRPRLVLMDEPLGALDRRLRESLQVEIVRIAREFGLTVVNVTHDQEEAFTISDKIAVLSHGKLLQYGPPEDLFRAPGSVEVADFLGESNVLHGVVELGREGHRLRRGDDLVLLTDQHVRSAGLVPGQDVVVVVRSWSARLVPLEDARTQRGRSWVRARIAAVLFTGDSRKIVLHSQQGETLSVRYTIDAEIPGVQGDEVAVQWDPSLGVVTSARTSPQEGDR
nr:ABC transporter ATP-binding protein [Nocardioides agariphilus]